ncbi:hypothetical protein PTNB73_04722 [Pyrenophora teres f. teres]|nr:hypothetical protein HRS9122_03545 [Pyrenophora teres f. teres]KAE8866628.1 hypothetical protein PTNB73_04722 [Pyrenophora teres f. teres]
MSVTELWEAILFYSDPECQYRAMAVSYKWREIIIGLLYLEGRRKPSCAAVQYGDRVEKRLRIPRHSAELLLRESLVPRVTALDPLVNILDSVPASSAPVEACLNIPNQAMGIIAPAEQAAVTILRLALQPARVHAQSFKQKQDRRWLGLSQFNFNPYLMAILSDRMKQQLDHCVIELRPGERCGIMSPMARSEAFMDAVGSMYATEPPCKALGFYVVIINRDDDDWYREYLDTPSAPRRSHRLERIGRITGDTGITIRMLMDGIQRCFDEAVTRWKAGILSSMQTMNFRPWKSMVKEEKFWACMDVGPNPQLIMLLESSAGNKTNMAARMYTSTLPGAPFHALVKSLDRYWDHTAWLQRYTAWAAQHNEETTCGSSCLCRKHEAYLTASNDANACLRAISAQVRAIDHELGIFRGKALTSRLHSRLELHAKPLPEIS